MQAQPVDLDQRAFVHLVRVPGVAQDVGGQVGELRLESIVRPAEIGEVHGLGLSSRIAAAAQHHFARLGGADAVREPQAQTPDGCQAPAGIDVGKLRRLRGNDEIGRQREFHGPRRAMSLNGGNHRLRKVGGLLDDLGVEMRFGAGLDLLEHFAHVISRREIGARAAQDDQADALRLSGNVVQVHIQRLEHILRERVQFLGTVEGQGRHPAVILPSDQFAHSGAPRYGSTNRRPVPETGRRCRNSGWLRPGPMPTRLADNSVRRSTRQPG